MCNNTILIKLMLQWRHFFMKHRSKSNVPVRAMKAYSWNRGIAPFIISHGTKWSWMANSMPWLLFSQKNSATTLQDLYVDMILFLVLWCRFTFYRFDLEILIHSACINANANIRFLRQLTNLTFLQIPYILESNPHPNLFRTSFCRFLKREKS